MEKVTAQKQEIDGIVENLLLIQKKEPEMVSAIGLVIEHISSTYNDKYDSGDKSVYTKTLLYSEDGKAINIYQVLRYLQRYKTKGLHKSGLLRDLLKGIHYMCFEVTRRVKTGDLDNTEPKE